MNNIKLNLARKWRSTRFDQVIGQDLVVRMLKNSLYLEHYFPVYLFAGQRGCGKTTMARIFAAALNCAELSSFRKNPQETMLPCLNCDSCRAMQAASHPDFIEIDAASHTGVDNVRNIIEASTMVPFLGNKKIYLIDESHMLSKAAFNAFLKILEEPPASVIFILATTDSQKILDTVKSRCFQLLFRPIGIPTLLPHLQKMCEQECIAFDDDGLRVLMRETHGSVRDAINLLEQVRFSAGHINKATVAQVLGHIDDDRLIVLLKHVLDQNSMNVLHEISNNALHSFSASFIWYRLMELLRACLWAKYNLKTAEVTHDSIAALAAHYSIQHIQSALEFWYTHEELFLKTSVQHIFLETLLLKLSYKKNNSEGSSGTPAIALQQHNNTTNDQLHADADEDEQDQDNDEESNDALDYKKLWQSFVNQIDSLDDPLLASIFKQGIMQLFDEKTKTVYVLFAKELLFFNDWLHELERLWKPLLCTLFRQEGVVLQARFDLPDAPVKVKTSTSGQSIVRVPALRESLPVSQHKSSPAQASNFTTYKKTTTRQTQPGLSRPHESKIDVSNVQHWKAANTLLQYFPGTITEIKERVL